jgi:hypothetical protein
LPGQSLYLEKLDVSYDERGRFNLLYDREVLPALRHVRGVNRVVRYQTDSPRDPRYLTVHDVVDPSVVVSPEWAAAIETTPWREKLSPFVMNRDGRVFARIGGNADLAFRTRFLLCVSIDIEEDKEALLNQLYDTEHIPLLMRLPDVVNVARYKGTEGNPRYLAIYEIGQPETPASKAWDVASDTGRWKLEVKPYTYNRSFVLYEVIDGKVPTGKAVEIRR